MFWNVHSGITPKCGHWEKSEIRSTIRFDPFQFFFQPNEGTSIGLLCNLDTLLWSQVLWCSPVTLVCLKYGQLAFHSWLLGDPNGSSVLIIFSLNINLVQLFCHHSFPTCFYTGHFVFEHWHTLLFKHCPGKECSDTTPIGVIAGRCLLLKAVLIWCRCCIGFEAWEAAKRRHACASAWGYLGHSSVAWNMCSFA